MKRSPIKRRTPLRSKRKHEPASASEPHPIAYAAGDMGELMAAATPRVQSLRKGVYGAAVLAADPKSPRMPSGTKAEREHKEALAQVGCMVCRRLFPFLVPGPVELHHRRGGGWGRGDYTTLIPLCAFHHRGDGGVHGLGTKGFTKHYGFTQDDLLADALALLRRDSMSDEISTKGVLHGQSA